MPIVDPSDSIQRRAALDPSGSFIVSAPAGSGKTGLITQRLLGLLASVENPEEILCITFTRKAAAEMTSRIQAALREADTEACPTDPYAAQTWQLARTALARSSELNWHILDMPGRMRIQTIDGFCRYIASQFALDTALGQLAEPSEQPTIYYRAAARTLLDRLEENSVTGQQLAVLLAHMGNDFNRCEELLSDLLSKREQWLPLIFNAADNQSYFQQIIDRLIAGDLIQLEQALKPVSGELIALTDAAASRVDPDKNPHLASLLGIKKLPANTLEGIPTWRILINLLMTKDHQWRKLITVKEGFPATHTVDKKRMLGILEWCREQTALKALMTQIRHLPDHPIDARQQDILDALAHLLPRLTAELNGIFQTHKECDYSAITLAAMEALSQAEPDSIVSDITLRLDYRLKHVLVDEFQDTSAAQIGLLESLLSGWQPDDGRSLFLVGDAMQSLYSFRNAKVGLFLRTQRQPLGTIQCQSLSLSTNFRSQKPIIDWVNEYFSEAFPKQSNIVRGAVPYSNSIARKTDDLNSSVQFIGYSGDNYEQFEAQRVAQICLDIRDNEVPQSVAILVRSRLHLRSIIPELKSLDLEWQATDIDPLATRMVIVDLLSLTRALLSPTDRVAWLSILRAPFCGLSLNDLLVITQSHATRQETHQVIIAQLLEHFDGPAKSHYDRLSVHGRNLLTRVLPILKDAWQNRARNDLRIAVETCWMQLGGYATLKSASEERDVERFLDLLSTRQVAGYIPDWDAFQLAVEKLYASPSILSERAQTQCGIHIMTIHKAKGLEFDQVLLPGLSRATPSSDKPLLRWQERIDDNGKNELLMAVRGAYDDEDDSLYQYLKYEQTQSTRLENTRILYVATTRAISRLHLFAELKKSTKGWNAPSAGSLLAPIWGSLRADIIRQRFAITEMQNSPEIEPIEATKPALLRRLPTNFRPRQAPVGGIDNSISSIPNNPPSTADSVDVFDPYTLRARQLGNTLHRALKQIAMDGIKDWPKSRLKTLGKGWRGQLTQAGILVTDAELQELQRALENTLDDSVGQWLLCNYTNSNAELALDYQFPEEYQMQRSVVDLTFISNDTRWIIDYKYSLPKHSESIEDFQQSMQRRYTAQLKHYSRLFRELGPHPVRCALYLPRIPMFIEISLD